MKKLFLLVLLGIVPSTFALDTPHAFLVPVKKTHQRAQRHHAHKAAKHKAPKRKYHTV